MGKAAKLHRKQRELALMIALDLGIGEIAVALGISRAAVHSRLSRAFRASGTCSRAALVGWCVGTGVIQVEELQQVYLAEVPLPQRVAVLVAQGAVSVG